MTFKQMTDRWRDDATMNIKLVADTQRCCADEADKWVAENMPGWVKITEDESTWPEDGRYILANPSGIKLRRFKFFRTHMSAYFGVWYRYLTDYDRPPS